MRELWLELLLVVVVISSSMVGRFSFMYAYRRSRWMGGKATWGTTLLDQIMNNAVQCHDHGSRLAPRWPDLPIVYTIRAFPADVGC